MVRADRACSAGDSPEEGDPRAALAGAGLAAEVAGAARDDFAVAVRAVAGERREVWRNCTRGSVSCAGR